MPNTTSKSKLGKSKRANVLAELLTVGILIFVIAIVFYAVRIVNNQINTPFQNISSFSNPAKAIMAQQETQMPRVFDAMILTLFVGLWIVSLIGAFQIDSHPIFFIISILLLGIYLFVGAVLGNGFESFITSQGISTYSSDFPMTNFLFDHIIASMMIVGITIVMVLYGKNGVIGR